MTVGRFKVECRPDRIDGVMAAIAAVGSPSRALPGVVPFDGTRSLTDPNAFVVEAGALTRELEWTVWEASPAD